MTKTKDLKWVKWTNEEHILCTNEYEPQKTKIACVIQTHKYYNDWIVYLYDRKWNEQPLGCVQGLRKVKEQTFEELKKKPPVQRW